MIAPVSVKEPCRKWMNKSHELQTGRQHWKGNLILMNFHYWEYYKLSFWMSSFWWHFQCWLHWKLSEWQLPEQPMTSISSKWQHYHFRENHVQFLWDILSIYSPLKLLQRNEVHMLCSDGLIQWYKKTETLCILMEWNSISFNESNGTVCVLHPYEFEGFRFFIKCITLIDISMINHSPWLSAVLRRSRRVFFMSSMLGLISI